MRRLLSLVGQRAKVRLSSRLDVAGSVFGNLLGTGTGLLFMLTLLHRTSALSGWTQAEVTFVWGFAEATVGLFYVVFSGLADLNRRYLLGGELDRCMLRPLDPLVQILADNVSPEDAPAIVVGAAAMALSLPDTGARLLLLPIWILFATATLGGLAIAFSSLGFHLRHRGTTFGLLLHLNRFARWPLDAFPAPIRWGLTVVLPLAWTGFIPAAFFLDHPGWRMAGAASPVMALLAMSFGIVAWRVGLKRYDSAGS